VVSVGNRLRRSGEVTRFRFGKYEPCDLEQIFRVTLDGKDAVEKESETDSKGELHIQLSEAEKLAIADRFAGLGQPPVSGVGIDFSNTLFTEKLNFQDFEFPEWTTFENSIFFDECDLTGAQFESGCDFTRCTFHGDVSVAWVKFLGEVHFNEVPIKGSFFLNRSSFSAPTDFSDMLIKEAFVAEGAEFSGGVDFRRSVVEEESDFSGVSFCDFVDFRHSSFLGPIDFRKSHFRIESPLFFNTRFSTETRFTRDQKFWPKATKKNFEDEIEAFTWLRSQMAKNARPDEEHFFFRLEMAAKKHLGAWHNRLVVRVFSGISDFGWSFMRPLCCLGFVWLVGMVVFLGYFSDCCTVSPKEFKGTPFWAAFGVSFSNTFGFLGIGRVMFAADFYRDLPQVLKFVSGLQTVFGAIFLFFFGLGLRNRFRLK